MTENNINTEVNFIDGFLIISSTEAIDPIIWRMELGNVQETIISIKKNKDNYDLKIKTSSNKEKNIASFETKDQAINVMSLINKSLEGKEEQVIKSSSISGNSQSNSEKKSYKSDIIMAVIGTILIFILISLIQSPSNNNSEMINSYNGQNTEPSIGKPLSADEFLESR